MLHTAGMGYDFFNATYNRLAQEKGQPSVITASKKALMIPCCSIQATNGNTGATWIGAAR